MFKKAWMLFQDAVCPIYTHRCSPSDKLIWLQVIVTVVRQQGCQPLHLPNCPCSDWDVSLTSQQSLYHNVNYWQYLPELWSLFKNLINLPVLWEFCYKSFLLTDVCPVWFLACSASCHSDVPVGFRGNKR